MKEFGSDKGSEKPEESRVYGTLAIAIAIITVPFIYISYSEYKERQARKEVMEVLQQFNNEMDKQSQKWKAEINRPTEGRITIQPPDYPQDAMKRVRSGTVRVQITANGNQQNTIGLVKSGQDRSLDEAALKAAKHAWIVPASRNGKNVKTTFQADIVFKIENYPYNTKGIITVKNIRQTTP